MRIKTFLLGLVALFASAQMNAQIVTGFTDTSEVVETGLTKSEMWVNLKTWVSLTFNNYEHSVDMEDQESGTMIVKWNIPIKDIFAHGSWGAVSEIYGTEYGIIKVEVKDGKYRWTTMGCNITIREANFEYKNLIGSYSIPVQITEKINKLEQELKGIPKYKNEKDEAKDKVNGQFKEVNDQLTYISNTLASYVAINDGLVDSLKKAMIVKDDF